MRAGRRGRTSGLPATHAHPPCRPAPALAGPGNAQARRTRTAPGDSGPAAAPMRHRASTTRRHPTVSEVAGAGRCRAQPVPPAGAACTDAPVAQGAGREVGAGLVALRAVVGKPVDVLLAGVDDRCAGVEDCHVAQEPIREVLDHAGMLGPWLPWGEPTPIAAGGSAPADRRAPSNGSGSSRRNSVPRVACPSAAPRGGHCGGGSAGCGPHPAASAAGRSARTTITSLVVRFMPLGSRVVG